MKHLYTILTIPAFILIFTAGLFPQGVILSPERCFYLYAGKTDITSTGYTLNIMQEYAFQNYATEKRSFFLHFKDITGIFDNTAQINNHFAIPKGCKIIAVRVT